MKKRIDHPSLGEEIISGLEEALAYEHGEVTDVKVTRATLASQRAEVAPDPVYRANCIASQRERLRLSQPIFAAALNVSPETVKKWEQGTRERDGAALRLLELAEMHPGWIISAAHSLRVLLESREVTGETYSQPSISATVKCRLSSSRQTVGAV